MVVRLRLSRFGCKNKPFYRVMAADSRSPRDGKHLEVLGYYNPLPGTLFSICLYVSVCVILCVMIVGFGWFMRFLIVLRVFVMTQMRVLCLTFDDLCDAFWECL